MSFVRASQLALIGSAVSIAVMPAGASGRVELSTTPPLLPGFRPAATDYVSRCLAGRPLRVAVRAPDGERVSVAGRPEQTGSFVTNVARRAGARTSVRVRAHGHVVRDYEIRCLPDDFPDWTIERHGTPQAQWYVTTPVKAPSGGYAAIFDAHGAPVWWWRAPSSFLPWDAKLLDDGLITLGHNLSSHFGVSKASGYEERTLGGDPVRQVHTIGSPTDVHDLERMPNGNFLAITYRRRDDVDLSAYGGRRHARVFDGEIQELTQSGRLVWRWNSDGHVDPSETGRAWWYQEQGESAPPAESGYDLLHVNSVEPDRSGVVVSARHLNAVFRVNRRTGDIDWKLGGSYVPGESLTVRGIPPGEPTFGGQHDARLWRDGTLTVFDNRTNTGGQPAADRFRIDAAARTATRIEHVTEPEVTESGWGGSARKLPGGNWVVCWGGANLVTEQTPAGAVVLALRFGGQRESYRAQPLPPGAVSAAALRRGMDAMSRARAGARGR